jgi:hypothetical protein
METTGYVCAFLRPPLPIKDLEARCPVFQQDQAAPDGGVIGCINCKYLIPVEGELVDRYSNLERVIITEKEQLDETTCKQKIFTENPDFLEID